MRIQNICNLRKYDGTWMWRTVEGNTGLYYTAAHGKGIFFMRDDQKYVNKMCTYEKFSSCKTASGTRRKLNRIFAELDHDPTPEDNYKLFGCRCGVV